MAIYANATPPPLKDGIQYAIATPLTTTEVDLWSGPAGTDDPIQVKYGEAILAVVKIAELGAISTDTAYVVMQTSIDAGATWIDCNWCVTTSISGAQTFVFSNGVAGANTFQQSRAAGTAPGSSGSNQMVLGGWVRFVGKATSLPNSQSSSSVGQSIPAVQATISYKIVGLR